MRTLTPFWTKRNLQTDTPFTLWKDMDELFNNFPPSSRAIMSEREFLPAAEVAETEKNYVISVDLPGMKKNEIKIEVIENVLSLTGERKREQRVESEKTQRIEKTYGFFERSFNLPANTNPDEIEAKYENGVLELSIPKTQMAQSKKIEVQ